MTIGLDFALNVIIQLFTVGVLGGTLWTRVTQLQAQLSEQKQELLDFRGLREDLAVVKSQLITINTILDRLNTKLESHNAARTSSVSPEHN